MRSRLLFPVWLSLGEVIFQKTRVRTLPFYVSAPNSTPHIFGERSHLDVKRNCLAVLSPLRI
jgi:hypothetical protein